jgi:hypothetical protein
MKRFLQKELKGNPTVTLERSTQIIQDTWIITMAITSIQLSDLINLVKRGKTSPK